MADYSGIDLQSLMTAPEGEMQSTEPAPMDLEAPVESPIEEPQAPEEMTLGQASIMDIVNVILGRFDLLPKHRKVLEAIPDEAKEKATQEPEPEVEELEGGFGDMDLESMGEGDVDEPVSTTGAF